MIENHWLSDWGWQTDEHQPIAAYIHVPFCHHRCGYCNFTLLANRPDLYRRYVDAVCIELKSLRIPRPVQTIFLGGGTPSLLPIPILSSLIESILEWLPWDQRSKSALEFSIETNPRDITPEFCQRVARWGVNRISIGGQSFTERKLTLLDRDHSPRELADAVKLAKDHFSSVSVDLIFGVPGETLDCWKRDLRQIIELAPHHISTYGLTYEKGAKFWGLREKRQIEPISEELELEMYIETIESLTAAGYQHYEVSNFSKPEHRCKHNQAYWQGSGWWAFGPSAARFVGRTRSVNHRGTIEYLKRVEAGRNPMDERERLTDDQLLRERFVFGMRQIDGVNWPWIQQLGPTSTIKAIEQIMSEHIQQGWMEKNGNQVRLTRSGLVLSDSLWSRYL